MIKISYIPSAWKRIFKIIADNDALGFIPAAVCIKEILQLNRLIINICSARYVLIANPHTILFANKCTTARSISHKWAAITRTPLPQNPHCGI